MIYIHINTELSISLLHFINSIFVMNGIIIVNTHPLADAKGGWHTEAQIQTI